MSDKLKEIVERKFDETQHMWIFILECGHMVNRKNTGRNFQIAETQKKALCRECAGLPPIDRFSTEKAKKRAETYFDHERFH